jgi:hypothetical protein
MTFARAALVLLIVGLALVFAGFSVDPLWPAQDAPPELARREAEAALLAGWIYTAGALALLGAVACVAIAALRRARR